MTLYCNRAFAEMFGFDTEADVYRFGALDKLPPEYLRAGSVIRADANMRDGAPRAGALKQTGLVLAARRKDGSDIWIEMNVQFVDWDGAPAIQVTVVDVGDGRRVEAFKSDFVATVSHELRLPLTSIEGALALIESGMASSVSANAMRLVRIAKTNSARLVRSIGDVLDLRKIEAGALETRFEPLSGHSLVREAVDAIMGFARQYDVSVEILREDRPAPTLGDRDQLTQVLTNLLSNAIKSSPPRSRVTVSVQHHGAFVRLSVVDRGIGIPPEFQARVFEPFSQAKSGRPAIGGGTGLGLSITKLLIERHFGTIGFISEPGAGTTFTVDLLMRDVNVLGDEPAASGWAQAAQ